MQTTAHRTRRPSGDPPPLPRDSHATGWLWASLAVVLIGIGLAFILTNDPDLHDFGSNVVEWFADLRTPWLTQVAKGMVLISSFGAVQLLRLAIAGALIATKRFRHLVVALASFVLVDWLVLTFLSQQRPAPGVSVLADSGNYTFPSWYVTAFAITVFAMPFVLAPAGRTRKRAMTAAWIAVILVCLARLYLGIDYPTNVAYAAVLCWVLSEALYRWFVPDESFPVSYAKGGKAAHLDLSGARGEAVKIAMGSNSGSRSPRSRRSARGLRRLDAAAHDVDRRHALVRQDLRHAARARRPLVSVGRTIMYGQLEDETRFTSVRRLIEYEDYALRVLATNGVDGRTHLRHRGAHAQPGVHPRDRHLRGVEERWEMPRSTTPSSTKGSR